MSQNHSLPSKEAATHRPILGGDEMARLRLQQKGDLYKQGGWWKLRWREDQIRADGRKGAAV